MKTHENLWKLVQKWVLSLLGTLMSLGVHGCATKDSAQSAKITGDELVAKVVEVETDAVEVPQVLEATEPIVKEVAVQESIENEDMVVEKTEAPKPSARDVERSRAKAIGRKLASVNTLDGTVYKDVTLQRIDDIGVSILHADGIARIGFDKLDEKWREEFCFSEEAAKAQIDGEREQQQAENGQRLANKQRKQEEKASPAAEKKNPALDKKVAALQKLADSRRAQVEKNVRQMEHLSKALPVLQGEEFSSTPESRKIEALRLENTRLQATITHTAAEIQRLKMQ